MAKRLTAKQKEEIKQSFSEGETIDFLSKKYECTGLTIVRNLKKDLGEQKYKDMNNSLKQKKEKLEIFNNESLNQDLSKIKNLNQNQNQNVNDFLPDKSFFEITPLVDFKIDDSSRKELSSIPISDVELPKIVFMIVDKNIELEIKLLKDFPDWSFLPTQELNRKTIEIYLDLNIAKRFCKKDQKVIKVPNTDVFKITAPILSSRGISRIVSANKLIAL